VGYNFRMSELPAAIGRCQLAKVEKFLTSFKKNAELIFDLLPDGIEPPVYVKGDTPAYFILGCTWEGKPATKFKFLEKLHKRRGKVGLLWNKKTSDIPGANNPPGYIIGAGYNKPLYDIPLYQKYKRACPTTEDVISRALWIDIHRWTTTESIQTEMDLFRKVFSEF